MCYVNAKGTRLMFLSIAQEVEHLKEQLLGGMLV
jgi:hypothetical protein